MTVSGGPEAQPHLGLRRAILPLGDAGRFQVFIHPRETHGVLYQLIERK